MNFYVKDTFQNQIYFRLSIQMKSAEDSTAKQPDWKSIFHVHEAANETLARPLLVYLSPPLVTLPYPSPELAKNTYLVIRVDLIQMLQ